MKLDLKELGWEGMECTRLARDRDRWRAFVDKVMNLLVPNRRGIS
jgi:hypothetical protein